MSGIEYGLGSFGDRRVDKASASLHAALVGKPGSCIRRLGGTRAREMQFTRFLRNDLVTVGEMSRHAGALTGQRVAGRDVVAIQDTSELVLGGRRARAAGYGPVGKGGALGGLLLHPVLAVDASNESLLGLSSMQIWNRKGGGRRSSRRKRKTADKESQRWIDGTKQASEVLARSASITMVCDREGDSYELFAQCPANVHLIVRACQNRRIDGPACKGSDGLLFTFIDSQAEHGRFVATIPQAPGRKARTAEFAVRFAPVVLRRPRYGDRALPATVEVTLVDVREISTPPDGSKRIHWRLITTHTVTNLAQAQRVLELYRLRWIIEEFFHTLKTASFDIEAADISEPQAMINLVAAATVAAVTVKQLVQARDGTTDQPLTDAFEPDDQPILEAVCAKLEGKTERQRNPHPKGSLAFAAWVLARLGGWTGYYGKPGPKVMRRGLDDFRAIKYGATLHVHDV
jgi:hypothetical protein